MKILFVSRHHPWPPNTGASQRRYHLCTELARRHAVTLVALQPTDAADSPERHAFNRLFSSVIEIDAGTFLPPRSKPTSHWYGRACRLVTLATTAFPKSIRIWQTHRLVQFFAGLKAREPFDGVWVDRAFLAEVMRQAGFRRFVVDLDDIESIRLVRSLRIESHGIARQLLLTAELAKTWIYEQILPWRFWRLVVCKDDDRQFFMSGANQVFVVPNGARDPGRLTGGREHEQDLLFVGSLDYEPNSDAVEWFSNVILPMIRARQPSSTFHIVGKSPPPAIAALADGKQTIVTGRVPDLVPYYESATVVVAPIRLGSGTKLKVLEALSYGKALVATSTAVEGLDLRPGVDFELADDDCEFAAACSRLLDEPATRVRLGNAGRERVQECYNWESIARVAERVLGSDSNLMAAT